MAGLAKMIGGRIKELRTKAGLSQDKLAEKAGISSKYLGEVERGVVNVTVQVLDDIAKGLQVPIDEILNHGHIADRDQLEKDIRQRMAHASDEELRLIHRIVFDILS
jgi:transcriptional regulator with XRE-family HTH domain